MEFALDSELENIRREARRLADAFDDDYWRQLDEKHEFPWDFYNAFAEQVRGQCERVSPEGEPLRCVVNGRSWHSSVWLAE